ncbi:MAG: HNH endonuclease signature motif containing protein [Candidatus Nanopelagicales bacterium]
MVRARCGSPAWPRQRLTCDAVLSHLTVDADGIPLRLGRSARVVSPALRRVIDVRDRHCVFAGCTAPAMWCQAHHLVHWEDGGPTDERNLALLCGHHHRAIHERGLDLRWTPDGQRIQTLRPDRTLIEVPAARSGAQPHPMRR